MQFGTGSTTELTQNARVKVQKCLTYVHTYIQINKLTSPIFDCVTPVSVSLATLARQLGLFSAMERAVLARLSTLEDYSRPIMRTSVPGPASKVNKLVHQWEAKGP